MSGEDLIARAREFEKNLLNFFWRQGLRLWNYRAEYEPTAKLSTFLFMLARQVRIDALRRQTRRAGREEAWGRDQPAAAGPAAFGAREDVRWALARLSEPLREVVELGVFQDLPYAEIGRILGIPVGTVKSRMSNAIKKLKEVFDDEGP